MEDAVIEETNPLFRDYTFQFVQKKTEAQTGPLSWSLPNETNPHVRINPTTGLLTVKYGHAYNNPNLLVRLTNINNDFVQNVYTINVVHAIRFAPLTVVNRSRPLHEVFQYTDLATQYNSQRPGTGTLSWTITSSQPDNLRIDSSSGVITYAANRFISEDVTVTTTNTLGFVRSITFRLNITQTPIIVNPGTLYVQGQNIKYFQYQFQSIVPTSVTDTLVWEVTELDGLRIDESSGVLTYEFVNIEGDQLLKVENTTYNVNTTSLASSFNVNTNELFHGGSVYVGSSVGWVYKRSGLGETVINPRLGKVVFSFQANSILTRDFRTTATNFALGYDAVDVTLNLEDVVVTVPGESLIAIQRSTDYGTLKYNVPYSISSSDTNKNKVPPGDFTPTSITGGSSVTLTWQQRPPAIVYITWTPSTTYNQPAVYTPPLTNRSSSLTIPGFMAGQQYNFIFSVMPTATTLADVKSVMYTPTYITPTCTVQNIYGATTIYASISLSPSIFTDVYVYWTPTSEAVQPAIISAGTSDIVIEGFDVNTEYTFTFEVQPDRTGIYGPSTSSSIFTPTYLDADIVVNDPVPLLVSPDLTLSWTFNTSPSDVVILCYPLDPLYATLMRVVPAAQQSVTVTGFQVGTVYEIMYFFNPDPSGIYGPYDYVQENIVVKTYATVSDVVATGGTAVTLSWNVNPSTGGRIEWLNQIRTFNADQTSLTLTNYNFLIGTGYIFNFIFSETENTLVTTATKAYTPSYRNTTIAINQPSPLSASSLLLSWRNVEPRTASSGTIRYKKPPVPDEPDVYITVPFTNTTNVSVTDLELGYEYEFEYNFLADTSGVYGPLTTTQRYLMKATPRVIITEMSGGTKITLGWQLVVDIAPGTVMPIDDCLVNITWIPATPTLGSGFVTSANGATISGFNADSQTRYRFTFSFQPTQSTFPLTYVHPPLNQPGYLPTLFYPDDPIITTTTDIVSPASANLFMSWQFGYTSNSMFNKIDTGVTITWNIATPTRQPVRVEAGTSNVQIAAFSPGSEYIFTLVFDPNVEGTALGKTAEYIYRVPTYPSVTDILFVPISNTVVSISWNITPSVAVTITASPTSGAARVVSVSAGTTSAIISGLTPNTSYQVMFEFPASSTTLPYVLYREYIS